MSGLMKSIAPGIALGGVALGLVAGFDRAMHPSTAAAGNGVSSAGADNNSCTDAQTHTGDTVQTRWGPVQVEASVAADGTICSSEAVVYPTGDGESIMINNQALPIIDKAVLSQGVGFDSVSGATITSEGYRASLQSVLDQL